uniref:VWFA domain-containing protein n=1 Tax=Sparus aurata TaxID=8175 RepID=A0A671WR03_SPAAU
MSCALCLTCSLEVAFILDSSESAKIFLFEKQKAFVLSFSTRLAMLQVAGWTLKVRMAALQYSSSVSIEHRFSAWRDLDSFHGRVSTMNYIGHGTYTTYAITNASQLLVQETPADSVRVAVLMTDGVDHPRNPDVISAAAEAKGHGIKFFAVGLSDIAQQSQNNAKLRAIASTPAQQFVQSLLNPQLEEKLLKEMVSLCLYFYNVAPLLSVPSGCGVTCRQTPLELVFVIDSSESVGPDNFNVIKDFVNALIDRASVNRDTTRVGVVLYSHINMVVVSLRHEASRDEIKSAVRSMTYLGEGTFTGSAIQQANQVFKAARAGVRKVAIIITDGQADKRDAVSLESAVSEAKGSNVEMFVIGVVNESDPLYEEFKKEINLMASDPDSQHVFLIDDFKTLPGEPLSWSHDAAAY